MVDTKEVEDDPQRRKPDISTAKRELKWSPKTKLMDGLSQTIQYFRQELSKNIRLSENQHDQSDLYLADNDDTTDNSDSLKIEL